MGKGACNASWSATRFTLIHLNMSPKIKDCLRFWKGAAELNGPPVVQIKAHVARKVQSHCTQVRTTPSRAGVPLMLCPV